LPASHALPDALLVRYFRAGEIEDVRAVKIAGDVVTVTLGDGASKCAEKWRDLGGGLGYVPDVED
jgi:hypothetical protein